jgi:hypothetical protein
MQIAPYCLEHIGWFTDDSVAKFRIFIEDYILRKVEEFILFIKSSTKNQLTIPITNQLMSHSQQFIIDSIILEEQQLIPYLQNYLTLFLEYADIIFDCKPDQTTSSLISCVQYFPNHIDINEDHEDNEDNNQQPKQKQITVDKNQVTWLLFWMLKYDYYAKRMSPALTAGLHAMPLISRVSMKPRLTSGASSWKQPTSSTTSNLTTFQQHLATNTPPIITSLSKQFKPKARQSTSLTSTMISNAYELPSKEVRFDLPTTHEYSQPIETMSAIPITDPYYGLVEEDDDEDEEQEQQQEQEEIHQERERKASQTSSSTSSSSSSSTALGRRAVSSSGTYSNITSSLQFSTATPTTSTTSNIRPKNSSLSTLQNITGFRLLGDEDSDSEMDADD